MRLTNVVRSLSNYLPRLAVFGALAGDVAAGRLHCASVVEEERRNALRLCALRHIGSGPNSTFAAGTPINVVDPEALARR